MTERNSTRPDPSNECSSVCNYLNFMGIKLIDLELHASLLNCLLKNYWYFITSLSPSTKIHYTWKSRGIVTLAGYPEKKMQEV